MQLMERATITIFFRMIAMPRISIAASDCMKDKEDLEEHILDNNYKEPLNCLFINLIPMVNKLYLLLGCDTRYDIKGKYEAIIKQFPIGYISYESYLGTLKGILIKCKKWCCSPSLSEDRLWKEFFDEYESFAISSVLG